MGNRVIQLADNRFMWESDPEKTKEALARVEEKANRSLVHDGYISVFDVKVALGLYEDTPAERERYKAETLCGWTKDGQDYCRYLPHLHRP